MSPETPLPSRPSTTTSTTTLTAGPPPKTMRIAAHQSPRLDVPSPGFGTFSFGPNTWVYPTVLAALRAGYRHIDTAWMYNCEEAIGRAMHDSGIARGEIFLTSKLPPHMMRPERVAACLESMLGRLGTDYVDLWLCHWPVAWVDGADQDGDAKDGEGKGETTKKPTRFVPDDILASLQEGNAPVVDLEFSVSNIAARLGGKGSFLPTWRAMQECVRRGRARAVGLSNFSVKEIKEILPHQDDVPLSVVQVEMHPRLPQNHLVEFANQNGILVEAYSIFGGNGMLVETLFESSYVKELAEKNGLEVGQMLVSWAVQRGTLPIVKSKVPSRIESNLNVVKLPQEVMDALNALEEPDDKGRTSDPSPYWKIPFFRED